jgi:hypothetical protein
MIISTGRAAQPRTEADTEATDLLCGAGELVTRLRVALGGQEWLDSFLLAAGLGQMVEDRLHADPLLLNRTAGYLRNQPSRAPPPGRGGGRSGGGAPPAARSWPQATDPGQACAQWTH